MDNVTAGRSQVGSPFAPPSRPDDRMDRLFARYYYARPDFIDGTTRFHRLCSESIRSGSSILEIGAGPANTTTAHLAALGAVVGLDIADEVRMNPHLAAAHVYDGGAFPFDGESFDACASNYVLEHVGDPHTHFAEIARVLRPGGVYCFRTPNLWHYIVLASTCVPHAVHKAVANRMRRLDGAHDPYPTLYRANTRRTIARLAGIAGLATVALPTVEAEPWYGRSHALLFYPMLCYERVVNSSETFGGLRANIFGVLQKPFA
jgi:SAM-dependent methyltransferase